MIERGLGEQSRFITYVLLIGRALSTPAEYRQLADYRRPADFRQLPEYRQPAEFRRQFDEERPQTLSDVQRGRLSQAADHLRRAARAHASLDVAAGQGLPDLEAVQIYQSVYEAVALAGIRAGDRVAETIAGLIATLDRIVEGAPVAAIDEQSLNDLERVLDTLAVIYSHRAERANTADTFESLLQWPQPLLIWM